MATLSTETLTRIFNLLRQNMSKQPFYPNEETQKRCLEALRRNTKLLAHGWHNERNGPIQIVLLLLFLALSAAPSQAQQRKNFPTSTYKRESINGFSILINPEVFKHKEEAKELLKEVDSQLKAIVRVVPAKPLSALKKVPIWLEYKMNVNGANGATYHPSAQWLKENGYNPDKARSVEVTNAPNFVKWSQTGQPWMLLHELAHGYHDIVFGFNNKAIEVAYKQAVKRKLYDSVEYINGGKKKAYAMTNPREYFAELSEAYFGKNDFFPFTRAELKTHDPVGYQLMQKAWGK